MFKHWQQLFMMILAVGGSASFANSPHKIKVYIAAPLFNARETHFNFALTKQLQQLGFETILPQQDGFEYQSLGQKIQETGANEQATAHAARDLIYLLDMGRFIPASDVIVANLDDPVDEGVIVEITYAHLMGKPVIGYRTDVRTPFGTAEGLQGLHSFVALQCDALILQPPNAKTERKARQSLHTLAKTISARINVLIATSKTFPVYRMQNPKIKTLLTLAKEIIPAPKNIHKNAELTRIVKRLAANKEKLQKLHINVIKT